MTARGFRALSLTLLCGALLCARSAPVEAAAKVLGPSKCTSCHEHEKQAAWATKDPHAKFDTRGNLPVWAKMCVDCHVLKDAKLIAAGHKSGADFDVGPSSQKIVHWAQTYDYAKLSAAGKVAAAARLGGAAPKPEAAKPPPPAPPTAAPVKPTLAAPETRPTSKPSPEARPTPKPAPETRPPAPAATAPPAPSPPPPATAVRETKPGAA